MEALIFLLIISTTNLVFCEDNAAIENNPGYEVQEETVPENDQLAEGSHIVSHTYGQNVVSANLKDIQSVRQTQQHSANSNEGHSNGNGDVRYTYQVQNVHQQPQQQTVQYLHDIRHKPIVVNEGGHSVQSQAYSHQQQQMNGRYPIHPAQMYAAQGPPSQQTYENGHMIGYQSYVEHVPKAEEEEIKSALKENSLGDIKRLVPKSGISFKIYHHEKTPNVKVTQHKIETQPEVSTITTQAAQGEFQNAVLHHRVNVQTPVQQVHIQTHEQQEHPQQIYLQQNEQGFANQAGGLHDQQAVYYTQQQVSTPRPVVYTEQEVNSPRPVVYTQHQVSSPSPVVYTQQEVSSPKPVVYTQHQVSSPSPVVYTQQEVNSPRPVVYTHQEVSSPRPVVYTQHEISSQRPAVEITPKGTEPTYKIKIKDDHRATSKVEFNKNTAVHVRHHGRNNYHKIAKQLKPENVQYQKELIEGVQKLAVSQNEGLGSYMSEGGDLYTGLKGNYITQQEQGKIGQFLHKQTNQPILNRLSGNYINEGVKTVVNLGTSAYSDYKTIQGAVDSEGAKTQQAVTYRTQFEAQSAPNNFDHQKALEGSTSFDIKNAIGNTEGVEHQTAYVTTTEIHPQEQFQKQQVTYNLPVMIDNTILKNQIEGQQIKFGQVGVPQFTYSQDIGGKFYQPQFIWTTEHIKGKELHQPLIQLHLPKEEIQYIKTQQVEVPGIVTHQQQPLVIQQNFKPQEIHFQNKKPQQYQTNLKLPQPVIIDWSLFKSKFPNVNINSLAMKPELVTYIQDPGKKIMPILVRKRKNRSNKEAGVVYGKATNRGPAKPTQRQEKNIHVNLVPSASNDVKQYDTKNERKNEFSVSASYKVDRSYKTSA